MAEDAAPQQVLADWENLQKKIFTRWVNQKLGSRHLPHIEDVLKDIGRDHAMPNLLFCLCERELPKSKKKAIIKAQQLEEAASYLQFAWDCGVEMKLKPSPDNILNGDFKDVMALMWAIMMKFTKFEDEDEQSLSAKDALLRWLQFHTKGYNGVDATNLTKAFHNGLAFCALLHKFTPKGTVDFDALNPADAVGNLRLAMGLAEKYFGIEQYIKPEEIAKLDEKSMFVYVSEYYYGVNEAAKRQLAAKRISKLIKFTRENDDMKAKYVADGERLLVHLTTAETLLADVDAIDNTMAGAKRRLANFQTYKSKEKRAIVTLHLEMEAQYNTLALRLSQNSRPEFVPENKDLVPKTLAQRIRSIQAKEVVEPALYAELNRQNKLVQLDKRHTSQSTKLQAWVAEKDTYLKTDVHVASSGEAQKQLKLLDAFTKESANTQTGSFTELRKQGEILGKEKYEAISQVLARETNIAGGIKSLDEQAAAKKPVLEDNLAREIFKEKVRLDVKVHSNIHSTLLKWCAEKAAYLDQKEAIHSVQEAKIELNQLEAFNREKVDVEGGSVKRLGQLGSAIRAASYSTQYSQWKYEHPEAVSALEQEISAQLGVLATKSAKKEEVLRDDLAREELKEKVLLWVGNHQTQAQQLFSWAEEKLAYLNTKEAVSSSPEAKGHLSRLEAFGKELKDMTEGALVSLKNLGAEIRATNYSTSFSQWRYEQPQEVVALEQQADKLWSDIAAASAEKKLVLQDDLAREEYAEQTRLIAAQHNDQHALCMAWSAEKTKELEAEIVVNSIGDAQVLISVLESYEQEKEAFTKSAVVSLKQIGSTVQARQYKTKYSSYVYEKSDEVRAREAQVDTEWSSLATLSQTRKQTLDALLKKEIRKEDLRLEFADLAGEYIRYTNDKVANIGSAEEQKATFGFTLQEVEAFAAVLKGEDAGLTSAADARESKYGAVVAEMQSLGVTANPYTDLTVANLQKSRETLNASVTQRQALYASELARFRENDALCKKFADIVLPIDKTISSLLATILDTSTTEEKQLETVNKALASGDESAKLADAFKLEADIKARGVLSNPHTPLSADDVKASCDNYMQVLQQKKPYLEKLIEYKRFKGIAPEQYEEMEQIFRTHDKDHTNSINEKEMRTCLFSLGEERSKSEIAAYMKQYGTNGALKFEQFRELMITLLGDTGSRDGLLESFKLISKGIEAIKTDALQDLLGADETKYFADTAAPKDGGYDFTAWVDNCLSR